MDANQLQLVLAAARPRPIGKKLTLFSSGDGVEWRTWRKQYNHAVAINGWDNARQLHEIAGSMDGSAALSVDDIDPAVNNMTPAQLLDAYELRFLPEAAGQLARTEFKGARQNVGETILQWHSRVRGLFTRAYPQGNVHDDRHLIETFYEGLVDAPVRRYVFDAHPATFAAALTVAQNKSATEAFMAKGNAPPPINALDNGVCWHCEQAGHQKRDCRIYAKIKKELSRNGGYGGGKPRGDGQSKPRGGGAGQGRGRGGRSSRGRGRGGPSGPGGPGRPSTHQIAGPEEEEDDEINERLNQLELTFAEEEEAEN